MLLTLTSMTQPLKQNLEAVAGGAFKNVHGKTPVLETLFYKATSSQVCNIIKRDSDTGVFQ